MWLYNVVMRGCVHGKEKEDIFSLPWHTKGMPSELGGNQLNSWSLGVDETSKWVWTPNIPPDKFSCGLRITKWRHLSSRHKDWKLYMNFWLQLYVHVHKSALKVALSPPLQSTICLWGGHGSLGHSFSDFSQGKLFYRPPADSWLHSHDHILSPWPQRSLTHCDDKQAI